MRLFVETSEARIWSHTPPRVLAVVRATLCHRQKQRYANCLRGRCAECGPPRPRSVPKRLCVHISLFKMPGFGTFASSAIRVLSYPTGAISVACTNLQHAAFKPICRLSSSLSKQIKNKRSQTHAWLFVVELGCAGTVIPTVLNIDPFHGSHSARRVHCGACPMWHIAPRAAPARRTE